MTTTAPPRWVDWEKLDTPVSEDQPEGESLRYQGTYDQVQDGRRRDDPQLAQGVWEQDLKLADWDRVIRLSTEALETRSKDLQIAAWLMEAWTARYQFEGVRHGLEVLFRLCEGFWETAYPKIEEEDIEARIGPFEWINTKLSVQLRLIPLSAPRQNEQKPVTFADYQVAQNNENQARKSERAREDLESELNYNRFFTSCNLTPPEYYRELATQVNGSRDRLRNLEGFLDDKCGKQSPSLLAYRETLKDIGRLVDEILERHGIDVDQLPDPEPLGADHMTQESMAESVNEEITQEENTPMDEVSHNESNTESENIVMGRIKSRNEAYRQLNEIADFLERTEPHSPTPLLIRIAVSWGNMTLNELLQDENDWRLINDLLRLKPGNEQD